MKTYDVKCYELALSFLQDNDEFGHVDDLDWWSDKLAMEIQEAIENWFEPYERLLAKPYTGSPLDVIKQHTEDMNK